MTDLTVVVCTRDRPAQLHPTLDALRADAPDVPVLVVDQGRAPDVRLAALAQQGAVGVLRDEVGGLSRARNLALGRVVTPWTVFVDDDCLVAPGWAAGLRRTIARHPRADFVMCDVRAHDQPGLDELVVTAFPVEREVGRSGLRTWPWAIGFGVCMAVRTARARELGGWDERLGAGVRRIPAGEDMDFNFRLLRAGGLAIATPEAHALHDQWRGADELPALFRGYAIGWAAFCVKHLRGATSLPALRLWCHGAYAAVKMVASAGRRRSRLRLRVGLQLVAGHAVGTVRGLGTRW